LGVNVVNVEVNDSGVTRAPASLQILAAARSNIDIDIDIDHKLHGGRQRGQERDGTGRKGWSGEVGVEDVEGAAVCRGGKGRWSLGWWGWL